MATIRKRGHRYHVQIRRSGHPPLTRSFTAKSDAERWARDQETKIDRGENPDNPASLRSITFGDLLRRYRKDVTPRKRGAASEFYRIDHLLNSKLSGLLLAHLNAARIAEHRDERLAQVKADTVRRELTIIRHVIEVARREWAIPMPSNPVAQIDKPPQSPPRERRLAPHELDLLLQGCTASRNPLLQPVMLFAIETGMRRGEILSMRWASLNDELSALHIPDTKTGTPRTIPLSSRARAILETLPKHDDDLVFPLSANALRLAWTRLRIRTGLPDLRFHDLRHEAISRFFEMGLSVPEVALISGHKDPRMLFRYTHMRAKDVAAKLG